MVETPAERGRWRTKLNQWWQAHPAVWRTRFWRWLATRSLFATITLWVFAAAGAYTLLGWLWGSGDMWSWQRLGTNWSLDNETKPLDRIKVTLTTIGGIGAVGYLVIKYRERASLERGEADEKLAAAVAQLGSESPQVRIAGVYALAHVADSYGVDYHQRVVDILCGYLRTDRLLKDENGDTRYAEDEDGNPDLSKPLSADGPVESTILKALADHLRSFADNENRDDTTSTRGPWSSCSIDLHSAILTEHIPFKATHIATIDMSGTTLFAGIDLEKATFKEQAWFTYSVIYRTANFQKSRFHEDAHFNYSDFRYLTFFGDSQFKKRADFNRAKFSKAEFIGARFECADFTNARFRGETDFSNSSSIRLFLFGGASFFGPATLGTLNARHTLMVNATFNAKSPESFSFPKAKKPESFPPPSPSDISEMLPSKSHWGIFDDSGECIEIISDPDTPDRLL